MTGRLDPHIASDALRARADEAAALLDQLHGCLRAAELVIAEARGVARYWDSDRTVVRIEALNAAIDAWDALVDEQFHRRPPTAE